LPLGEAIVAGVAAIASLVAIPMGILLLGYVLATLLKCLWESIAGTEEDRCDPLT
jgi:hypothetical protein